VVLPLLARVLRLASLAICLIAVAWFVTFAVQQSSTAAAHQASEVYGASAQSSQTQPAPAREGGLHKALNSAFKTLSSPFSSVVPASGSQWKIHIVDALLALLVYGLGLGFIARMLRLAA
jgi:hypothetical protein